MADQRGTPDVAAAYCPDNKRVFSKKRSHKYGSHEGNCLPSSRSTLFYGYNNNIMYLEATSFLHLLSITRIEAGGEGIRGLWSS